MIIRAEMSEQIAACLPDGYLTYLSLGGFFISLFSYWFSLLSSESEAENSSASSSLALCMYNVLVLFSFFSCADWGLM